MPHNKRSQHNYLIPSILVPRDAKRVLEKAAKKGSDIQHMDGYKYCVEKKWIDGANLTPEGRVALASTFNK